MHSQATEGFSSRTRYNIGSGWDLNSCHQCYTPKIEAGPELGPHVLDEGRRATIAMQLSRPKLCRHQLESNSLQYGSRPQAIHKLRRNFPAKFSVLALLEIQYAGIVSFRSQPPKTAFDKHQMKRCLANFDGKNLSLNFEGMMSGLEGRNFFALPLSGRLRSSPFMVRVRVRCRRNFRPALDSMQTHLINSYFD